MATNFQYAATFRTHKHLLVPTDLIRDYYGDDSNIEYCSIVFPQAIFWHIKFINRIHFALQ